MLSFIILIVVKLKKYKSLCPPLDDQWINKLLVNWRNKWLVRKQFSSSYLFYYLCQYLFYYLCQYLSNCFLHDTNGFLYLINF